MRRAARVDENQKQIVADLRKCGYEVYPMHQVGEGFPDLLISDASEMWLVEVKSKSGKLTEAQEEFITKWRGKKIIIARSFDELLQKLRS